jgi:hypothetical protein
MFGFCLLLFIGAESTTTETAERPGVPDPDDDERGAVGGMLGKGTRSSGRTSSPVPLCPPQIPHDLTRARTRAAVVGKPSTSSLSYCIVKAIVVIIYFKLQMWFYPVAVGVQQDNTVTYHTK